MKILLFLLLQISPINVKVDTILYKDSVIKLKQY